MKKPFTVVSIVIALALVGASVATGLPIAPYPTAPLCASHDARAYHGLWNADLGCHYNHTHGDNPHELDALFGDDLYTEFGGEISYPWQTYSAAGFENDLKHQGYYWVVRSNIPCPVATTSAGCVTDFRALVHFHADGHDTPVRYHSFYLEARVCPSPAQAQIGCGYAKMGGWQDTGDLLVDGVTVIDSPNNGNCHKQHSATSGMAVWYPCFRYGQEGGQGLGRASLAIHNEWDYTSPAAPSVYTDTICYGNPRCVNNGSFVRPHLISVDIPDEAEALAEGVENNIVESFVGFTTPYGVIDPTCTEVNAVCAPLVLTNLATKYSYSYTDVDPGRSYDVWFCNGVQCTATSPGRRTANWIVPLH